MRTFSEYLKSRALTEEEGGAPAGGDAGGAPAAGPVGGETPSAPIGGAGPAGGGHTPPPPPPHGGHGGPPPHGGRHPHPGAHGHGHWFPVWMDRLPHGWHLRWIGGILWLIDPAGRKIRKIARSTGWSVVSGLF